MADIFDKEWDQYLEQPSVKLQTLDDFLQCWEELRKKTPGALTSHEIESLKVIAEKHLYNRQLTGAQRETKSQIHKRIGAAFRDIWMLMRCDFMGSSSRWDPTGWKGWQRASRMEALKHMVNPKTNLPYDLETWKKDVPILVLVDIVRTFVEMYGDEYAAPLAKAIECGLQVHDTPKQVIVEVPIIKKLALEPMDDREDPLDRFC
jgi:hypothetical protein